MGEGRLTGDASPANLRLTVPEAAARLGMTEVVIRGRIKRRTLRSERESGTVYVLLEGDEPPINRDEPYGESTDQYERVEDLREQVAPPSSATRRGARGPEAGGYHPCPALGGER